MIEATDRLNPKVFPDPTTQWTDNSNEPLTVPCFKPEYISKNSNFSMSVYAGKYCHFPENSGMEVMIRFGSEALGTTKCPIVRPR